MKVLKSLMVGQVLGGSAPWEGSGTEGEVTTFSYDVNVDVNGIDFSLNKNKAAFEANLNSGEASFSNFVYVDTTSSFAPGVVSDAWSVSAEVEYTAKCVTQADCEGPAFDAVSEALENTDGVDTGSIDVSDPVVEQMSCVDGTNGGCSHFCTDNECSCPPCWSLDVDMKTCSPDDGTVTIQCDADSMSVTVSKCVLDGNDVNGATLVDGVCAATESGDDWVISTDLDGCGTTFNLDAESQIVDFSNTFALPPTVVNGLVMSRSFGLDMTCQYETSIDDISANRTVIGGSVTSGLSGSGALAFDLTFFTNSGFDTEIEEDSTILVGETIFYNVAMANPISGLEFTVLDCTVFDADAGESYDIYAGQCADQFVGTTVDSLASDSELRFSYTAFQFASSDALEANEKLSCTVLVCDSADSASPCQSTPTCAGRKKRSTDEFVNSASIFKAEAVLPKFR